MSAAETVACLRVGAAGRRYVAALARRGSWGQICKSADELSVTLLGVTTSAGRGRDLAWLMAALGGQLCRRRHWKRRHDRTACAWKPE